MSKIKVKILTIALLIFCQNACAIEYSCQGVLSEKDQKLLALSEHYIEKKEMPLLPHGENIYAELKEARNTGLIACIAIKFYIDHSLNVTNTKILNKKYNRSIGRNSIKALKKYKFKESSKDKEALVIMQFELDIQ